MENTARLVTVLTIVITVLAGSQVLLLIQTFRDKGPTAKELIENAQDSITTAIRGIEQSEINLDSVYLELEKTRAALYQMQASVARVNHRYAQMAEESNRKISDLKNELKEEEDKIEQLKLSLVKLE